MEQRNIAALHRLSLQFPARAADNMVFIDEFTYGSPEVKSWGDNTLLRIGKFCSIADRVTIFLGGEHRSDWVTTYPFSALLAEFAHIKGAAVSKGSVLIGNDIWIGSGATILSGVTIGDGAIIGANSVVTKHVPSYAIVAGNPARVIRYRFSEEIITDLLEIKWWNWDKEELAAFIPLLQSNQIEQFVERAKQRKDM